MANNAREWTPAVVQNLPSTPSAENDEVDAGELVKLFWRNKWWIAAAMVLSMGLGFLYALQFPNLYSSEARLILASQEQNATGLDSLVAGISNEDTELHSQIEVIKSRSIVGAVVDRLNLQTDPEYVLSLREESIGTKVKDSIKKLFRLPYGRGDADHRKMAIDQLIQNLKVEILPKTQVFKISLETENPLKSVEIVNALADEFVDDQILTKLESNSKAATWLEEKVLRLGASLEEAEEKAANFRTQTERAITEQDLLQSNLSLKNARGRLDTFKSSLRAATGSDIPESDRDRQRQLSLLNDIAKLEGIVGNQTQDLLTIRQLDREARAAATIYEHFVQRLNEIEVQKGLQDSDVRVLSEAVSRGVPTKPRKHLIVAVFGLLGLVLSGFFLLCRKLFDRSFYDPATLQRAFGIPVIGTISRAPMANRKELLKYAIKRPSSAIMEAIRDLRTSLLVSIPGGKEVAQDTGTVMVFTSSVPGEGKTTSSILLAVNSAALDKKVLLVECDLRRSTFRTYFGEKIKQGLLHAIETDEGWAESIWTEPKTKVDIIFGGESKILNAGDVFASANFSNFLDEMKARYDLIILDSPPVLPVPDARLIAMLSDKIVYAVRSASTSSSTVSAGLRLFANMDLKPDGLILTQVTKKGGYGYSGYGYGSEYYRN